MNDSKKVQKKYLFIIGIIISINILILGFIVYYNSQKETNLGDTKHLDHHNHPNDHSSHNHNVQNDAYNNNEVKLDDPNMGVNEKKNFSFYEYDTKNNKVKKDVELDLFSLKNNIIWIHLWTTWCPVCRKEAPIINEIVENLSKKYNKDHFKFIYMNIDEKKENLTAYLKNKTLNYPIYVPKSLDKFARDYLITAIPHNIVLSHESNAKNENDAKFLFRINKPGSLANKKEDFINLFKIDKTGK